MEKDDGEDEYQIMRLPKLMKSIDRSSPSRLERKKKRLKFLESNDDHISYDDLNISVQNEERERAEYGFRDNVYGSSRKNYNNSSNISGKEYNSSSRKTHNSYLNHRSREDDFDRILDHMWYDRDDESFIMCNNYDEENSKYLMDKEVKRQSQLPNHRIAINKNRKSTMALQKHIDTSLWELTRLQQGGAGTKLSTMEIQELNTSNVHKDEDKLIVLVRNVIPPFIYEIYGKDLNIEDSNDTFNQIYNKFLNQSISVVKDPTSDIAQMAKKGSLILRQLKEESDRNSTRVRFWDLEGSKLGTLLKLDGITSSGKDPDPLTSSLPLADSSSNLLSQMGRATPGDRGGDEGVDGNGVTTSAGPRVEPEADLRESKGEGRAEESERNTGEQYHTSDASFNQLEEEEVISIRDGLKSTRENLPVYKFRDELLYYINEYQILIIVGETGSGKTTQIPQYLYEAGYSKNGIIGCTQPRRVAAMSVAKRVSEEVGSKLGDVVGYTIRFEDCTSNNTKIKFMTDGILLRETLIDNELDKYSCIIMDEAHERSLNTDVLFGILKSIISKRLDIRIIITSATMDTNKFSIFFGNCPIFNIKGRTYPVRIEYLRTIGNDYIELAVNKCISIHINESVGDILIFMTGQDDINTTCELLDLKLYKIIKSNNNYQLKPLYILPIYSQLPNELQQRVFKKYPYRKVIISTNIAETSLTFDGIKYVIDTGLCKLKVYNPKIGMDSLQITPISQAGANQRSGRAGRTAPGICYRLYTERTYINDLMPNNVPEIKRTNLCNVILLLKSLNINKLTEFQFIDPPNIENILSAMLQLWILGAINEYGELTTVGSRLVQYPLEPPLAKIIISGEKEGCLSEVLTIVSVLSAPNIFIIENESDADRESAASACRDKFLVPESDHLTLLNVYNQWVSNGCNNKWCLENKLQHKSLNRAFEVRQQLVEIINRQKVYESSCGNDWDSVRKAICSGYFHNASKLKGFGEYSNLRSFAPCFLHPSSALYGMGYTPDYVVYHEVIITSKEYMRHVTAVYPEWLYQLGPNFFYLKNLDSTGTSQRIRDKLENQRLLQDLNYKRNKEELESNKDALHSTNKNNVKFGSRR